MKCVGQFFIKTFDLGAGGGAELWITLYNKLFSCNYDIVNKNLRYSYIYCFCFVLIIHLSGLLQNLSLSQCVLMIQEKMVFKSKRSSQRQDLLLKASKCGSTNLGSFARYTAFCKQPHFELSLELLSKSPKWGSKLLWSCWVFLKSRLMVAYFSIILGSYLRKTNKFVKISDFMLKSCQEFLIWGWRVARQVATIFENLRLRGSKLELLIKRKMCTVSNHQHYKTINSSSLTTWARFNNFSRLHSLL